MRLYLKTIGDEITINEINSIQTLINENLYFRIPVTLQSQINTDYGNIIVNYGNEFFKRKSGIITNELKIKITRPYLEVMNFKLELKYKTLSTDLLDNNNEQINYITYNIPVDKYVTINEATTDNIILYDIVLIVDFNKPFIQKYNHLTVKPDIEKTVYRAGVDGLNLKVSLFTDKNNIGFDAIDLYDEDGSLYDTQYIEFPNTYANFDLGYLWGEGRRNLTFKSQTDNNVTLEYVLNDSAIYDVGTIEDYDARFYNHANRLSLTRDEEGTILENKGSSTGFYFATYEPASNLAGALQWEAPFSFELTLIQIIGNPYVQVYNSTSTVNYELKNLNFKNGDVLRVDVDTDKVNIFLNNTLLKKVNVNSGISRCGFGLSAGAMIKYKEFHVW